MDLDLATEKTIMAMDDILKKIEEINVIIDSIDESFDLTDTDKQKG